jgi:hypothetical protein
MHRQYISQNSNLYIDMYFKYFKYCFQPKNGKLCCSIIFMSMQFYSILLHLNFSVLTADRVSLLTVKRSGEGWEENEPFQINEAAICHASRRSR